MSQHDPLADNLAQLLRETYAAAPDEAFSATLLHRLTAGMPATRPTRRYLAVAAGLTVISTIGLAAYMLARRASPLPSPSALPAPQIARAPTPAGNSDVRQMRVSSLTELVARSPYWLRVRLLKLDGGLAQYHVVYPIYGNFPDATFTVDLSDSPTNPREIAGLDGTDRVIELRPLPPLPRPGSEAARLAAAGITYQRAGIYTRADEAEAEILQAVTDGSAYSIVPRRIGQMLIEAPVVVRATLVQAGGANAGGPAGTGESTWTIKNILKGDPNLPHRLTLDDQFFRQRASTIVAAADRKQHEPPAATAPAPPPPALVEAEIARLVKSELTPPVEAILFLDQVQPQGETLHARLRYRDYEDATHHKLDTLESEISGKTNSDDPRRL